jgi:hypothetical protein
VRSPLLSGAWYLQGEEATPPAIARWHAHARTNGGLVGVYGRVGPEGRAHCAACTGMPETTMHVHRHCPRYAAPRAHLPRAIDEWRTDAATGGARLTREEHALRWAGTRERHGRRQLRPPGGGARG